SAAPAAAAAAGSGRSLQLGADGISAFTQRHGRLRFSRGRATADGRAGHSGPGVQALTLVGNDMLEQPTSSSTRPSRGSASVALVGVATIVAIALCVVVVIMRRPAPSQAWSVVTSGKVLSAP